jgi:hypothetical protein
MPGKRMGSAKRIRGGRPTSRPRRVTSRPAASRSARRGASPRRVQTRTVKRIQTRQTSRKVSSRPRPVVRPVSVPNRRLPKAMPERPHKGMVNTPISPSRRMRPSTSRAIKRGAVQAAGAAMGALAVGQLMRLNTSVAHPDISRQVDSLQGSIDLLEDRANMSEVRADIANLDANLNHAISLLESARDKGYYYQSDLEDIAYDAMSRWQAVRGEVDASITSQANEARNYLRPVNQRVNQLNPLLSNAAGAAGVLSQTEGEVRKALQSVADLERSIEAVYADIEQQATQLVVRLTRIHWVLTQRDEASFDLLDKEEVFMAVKARWDQEGKDDPEGILFLTNQRLIFERKEKVATKKVLFVATAKELVQQVLGAQPLGEIKTVKAQNKGVFGHQDFLEVDFGKQMVSFHLDGQDSKDWAVWISDAKSGKLDQDRASGSKLSFADLTGPLTQADILDLQNEINELQDEMMLRVTQDELSELENKAATLSRELAELRARGYVVEKSLEADIEVLNLQWEKIKTRSQATLDYQTSQLGSSMKSIQEGMAKLAGMTSSLAAARPVYINLKSMIASAEAQAEAAEETVLDQYDEYADEVEMLDTHLEWVDWMLDAISTASFKLLATEGGVAAVEAVWERPGLPPENGILFLTDQRLLWEDRVGEYELKLEVPLSEVLEAKDESDEETKTERLVVSLGGNAPVSSGIFVLSQPVAEEWLQMIGRARSGGYAGDRAVEIDEAELDRIRNAPTECPNCGAAYTAPILRGQDQLVCEFCGVATRF